MSRLNQPNKSKTAEAIENRHKSTDKSSKVLQGNLPNSQSISQKKVAHALLKMTANKAMLHHFVNKVYPCLLLVIKNYYILISSISQIYHNKGGVEAIYKLCSDTKDMEVISVCASCLAQICSVHIFCPTLVDKQILSNLVSLIENGDEHVRLNQMFFKFKME
jgi:hypothetical protein